MANYLLSYDLNGSRPTHAEMDKHIEGSGWAYARILETVWYIGTDASLEDVYNYVNSILSANDRVIVAEASNAYYRNLLVDGDSFNNAWNENS